MLHIIKTCQALNEAKLYATEQDAILLIEDAVYAANERHYAFPVACHAPLFALRSDLEARAITTLISPHIRVIGYDGFVDLTVTHSQSMTWE